MAGNQLHIVNADVLAQASHEETTGEELIRLGKHQLDSATGIHGGAFQGLAANASLTGSENLSAASYNPASASQTQAGADLRSHEAMYSQNEQSGMSQITSAMQGLASGS